MENLERESWMDPSSPESLYLSLQLFRQIPGTHFLTYKNLTDHDCGKSSQISLLIRNQSLSIFRKRCQTDQPVIPCLPTPSKLWVFAKCQTNPYQLVSSIKSFWSALPMLISTSLTQSDLLKGKTLTLRDFLCSQ